MATTPVPKTRSREVLVRIRGGFLGRVTYGLEGRTVVLGALVGVLAGLAAAVFYALTTIGVRVLLDDWAGAGLAHPDSSVELWSDKEPSPWRWWLIVILPAAGGLASGLVSHWWAPEVGGGGIDPYVRSFHHDGGCMRRRVPFAKLLATTFTVSTGGAVGREGAIMQIGSGLAASVGRALRLSPRERRILVICGGAAGVGALFRAPLAGAIGAIEVLYTEDFESDALVPSIISSVTAFAIFTMIFGNGRLFGELPYALRHPAEMLPYVAVGVACGPTAAIHVSALGFARRQLERVSIPRWALPALGGFGVGVLGIVDARLLGDGYGLFQDALSGQVTVFVLALLLLGRVAASALSVGSGGSGGLMAPTLVIGGLMGAIVGAGVQSVWPDLVPDTGAYVVVGMAGLFAGVANTPIASVLMVSEITGSYELLAPAMLVTGVSMLVTRRFSLYEDQVRDRFHSPAHRAELTVNVLENLSVRRVFDRFDPRSGAPIDVTTPMSAVRARLSEAPLPILPVCDAAGALVGQLTLDDVREGIFVTEEMDDIVMAADMMSPLATARPDDNLHRALIKFIETGQHILPVVDPELNPDQVLGFLTQDAIIAAYNEVVAADVAEPIEDESRSQP